MEIRSFLAFELPPEIRRIICDLSGELRKSSLDVRWVTATNIHLTLVFMGKVHMEDLEPINETVANVCRRYRTFNLSLKRRRGFRRQTQPQGPVGWSGWRYQKDVLFPGCITKTPEAFWYKRRKA